MQLSNKDKYRFLLVNKHTNQVLKTYIFTLDEIIEGRANFANPDNIVVIKQQSTGMFDKNGVEIFDGDAVRLYELPGKPYDVPQEIFFEDGMFCIGVKGETETPLSMEVNSIYRGKVVNLVEVLK